MLVNPSLSTSAPARPAEITFRTELIGNGFLRARVTERSAVARLAGVAKEVLERAKEILRNLEESELTPEGNVRQANRRQQDREKLQRVAPPSQMDLFG